MVVGGIIRAISVIPTNPQLKYPMVPIFMQNLDPYVWLLTLPLAVGLLWVRRQPSRHAVKQFWEELMQADAMVVGYIGFDMGLYEQRQRQAQRVSFWLLQAVLAIATVGSLGGYVGLWG
jgi:hypothetical protein